MRLALVCRQLPPLGGGIGAYTEKTAAALAALGHEVHVVSEAPDGRPGSERRDGVVVHRLAPSRLRPRTLGRAWTVARALRRLGPFDVVQGCEWGGEAALFALRPTAPLVTRLATPHFLIERLNGVPAGQRRRQATSRLLERLQARRSARVISPSTALADQVAAAWRLPREAITVVPTGIRLPHLDPAAPAPEGITEPFVLYFGRLERRKGVDVWLEALPRVLQRHPELHAVLAGDDAGIDGRPVADLARELCAEHSANLHLLPHLPQDRLFPLVARATLVVLPSRWENLANTCLEAMALGRPVLATTGSGFEPLIRDGVEGLLVPPGDAEALAAAALRALADPAALQRMGEAARRRAAEYELGAMAVRLAEVHESLLPGAAQSQAQGRAASA